jgi:hypothetical protein
MGGGKAGPETVFFSKARCLMHLKHCTFTLAWGFMRKPEKR